MATSRSDEEAALLGSESSEDHEPHVGGVEVVSQIILGASDGLTVPFALAAGLTGAFRESKYVVVAVLSELAAGAISMGLGGFLSGRSEVDFYHAERRREQWEVQHRERDEVQETVDIFRKFGLKDEQIDPICEYFKKNPESWVDFMMQFELGLEKPDEGKPLTSAAVIGISYLLAGFVPLTPYLIFNDAIFALKVSIFTTCLALFLSGYFRSKLLKQGSDLKAALETMVTGIAAAGAAYFIASLVPS